MNLITVRPQVRKPYRTQPTFANVKTSTNSRRPALNVLETADSYRMEFAVPGLTKEDISIKYKEEHLFISAKKTVEPKEREQYARHEFGAYDFSRKFQLPEDINVEAIEATVKDGILQIRLGKKDEKELAPRKIEVA